MTVDILETNNDKSASVRQFELPVRPDILNGSWSLTFIHSRHELISRSRLI